MDETALRRPENDDPAAAPSRAWRRVALAVPVLAVLGCAGFAAFMAVTSGWDHKISAACSYLPLPWYFWALSYGGLVAALGCVVLHILLRRRARAYGWQPAAWRGGLADSFAVLGWLAVLLAVVAVLLTQSEQSDYSSHHEKHFCEGLAVPGA